MGWGDEPKRKEFKATTKRREWLLAAGKDPKIYEGEKGPLPNSKCRRCGLVLVWGEGSYEFDHKDNNPRRNTQGNCYLVCRVCHGKATKTEKRAERDWSGNKTGYYKTVKLKVDYKKPIKRTPGEQKALAREAAAAKKAAAAEKARARKLAAKERKVAAAAKAVATKRAAAEKKAAKKAAAEKAAAAKRAAAAKKAADLKKAAAAKRAAAAKKAADAKKAAAAKKTTATKKKTVTTRRKQR